MTTVMTVPEAARPNARGDNPRSPRDGAEHARRSRGRGRTVTIGLLIGSLLLVGVTRSLADRVRVGRAATTEAAGIGRLDSFTLGLLLGGLRGPLVMALWTTSESQKAERRLEDFDTRVELIRLLQPEFDTVHLFQIWNKAYNISVQMANLPNRYAVILDALDYAFAVRAERPDNINMEAAIAGIFFNKLGEASEREYYRRRMLEETRPSGERVRVTFPAARRAEFVDAARMSGVMPTGLTVRPVTGSGLADADALFGVVDTEVVPLLRSLFDGQGVTYEPAITSERVRDEAGRRLRYDTLVDAEGSILPHLLRPDPRYANRSARLERENDVDRTYAEDAGGELSFLEAFQPLPRGVDPFALGYNSYKKAQSLNVLYGQSHAQLSDRVIHSRPALALQMWTQSSVETGRRIEIAAVGLGDPDDDYERQTTTAEFSTEALNAADVSRPLLARARESYLRAIELARSARVEFGHHLTAYRGDERTYASALDWMHFIESLATADARYLDIALVEDPALARSAAQSAEAAYAEAGRLVRRQLVKYYLGEQTLAEALPVTYRPNIDDKFLLVDGLTAEQIDQTFASAMALLQNPGTAGEWVPELQELNFYLMRIETRMDLLRRSPSDAGVSTLRPGTNFASSGKYSFVPSTQRR